jgi:cytochrome c-type biogenesis protein CcmH
MLFWIAAAIRTVVASLAGLLPVRRRPGAAARAEDHDLEVYKDQLREVERDLGRGVIGAAEAEEARAEIGRRILRLAAAAPAPDSSRRLAGTRYGAMAAVLVVPLVGWAGYALLGSPDLPPQPLSARLSANPASNTMEELVARAERHLAQNPEDGKGWDVLGPIYLRIGRFDDAIAAFGNAIRREGATANREAGLGEALAARAGGLIRGEAAEAFRRALALEPGMPKARFYLATALAQEGKLAEAMADWSALRDTLPMDSPWRAAVQEAVAEAGRRLASGDTPAAPGPSQDDVAAAAGMAPADRTAMQDDVAAAAGMAPADRTAMIESMVAGLDRKLKENPQDREGWQRLIRSYLVLQRKDDALAALDRATAAFGEDSAEAGELAAFAAELGLARTE